MEALTTVLLRQYDLDVSSVKGHKEVHAKGDPQGVDMAKERVVLTEIELEQQKGGVVGGAEKTTASEYPVNPCELQPETCQRLRQNLSIYKIAEENSGGKISASFLAAIHAVESSGKRENPAYQKLTGLASGPYQVDLQARAEELYYEPGQDQFDEATKNLVRWLQKDGLTVPADAEIVDAAIALWRYYTGCMQGSCAGLTCSDGTVIETEPWTTANVVLGWSPEFDYLPVRLNNTNQCAEPTSDFVGSLVWWYWAETELFGRRPGEQESMVSEFPKPPEAGTTIALTFDAGGEIEEDVLQTIEQLAISGQHITVFFTGQQVKMHSWLIERLRKTGIEVGNHSFGHPNFCKLSEQEIRAELQKANEALRATGPVSQYFRFPFGVPVPFPESGCNTNWVVSVVESEGYEVIGWDVTTDDYQNYNADSVAQQILKGVRAGGRTVVLHIGGPATAEALQQAVPILLKEGYRVGTISEVLR